MLLQDNFAVVTGAATETGIGYATARVFAEHGAAVALLDLERNDPHRKASMLGKQHRGYVCDVTQREACQSSNHGCSSRDIPIRKLARLIP
jgi:NAD(P)-dependent dehydrogenase (short-subunit alcohol dehydrogenase family)